MDDVVVWNLDARHRPELEVEIELVRDAPRPPAVPMAAVPQPLSRRPTATKLDELFVDDLA